MVKVNGNCIGCGACVSICPQVFELGSDSKSHVREDAELDAECIGAAKNSCPVAAIEA